MANIIIPDFDNDVQLVSDFEYVTIRRIHATQELYSIQSKPSGNVTTEWSRAEVKEKIESLLQKGWEYKTKK